MMKVIRKHCAVVIAIFLIISLVMIPNIRKSLFAEEDKVEEVALQSTGDREGKILSMQLDGTVEYIDNNVVFDNSKLEIDDDKTFELKKIDENGEVVDTVESFDSFEDANEALAKSQRMRNGEAMAVFSDGQVRSAGSSLVNFNTRTTTTQFREDGTNVVGYLYGGSGADGAYLGTNGDGSEVKFKIAGVVGWVSKSTVEIVPYTANSGWASYYTVQNGRLVHKISSNVHQQQYWSAIDQGKAPSYLAAGVNYLSYDGHYFYRDNAFSAMVSDYQNNTYANSVNPSSAYYNYFQFLSYRSTTNFTGQQLDARTNAVVGNNNSKLKGLGNGIIEEQNKWGANALLTYGIACNESAYGTSNYAINRNNLFGHAAYDSDPDGSATSYSSPIMSVRYHDQGFISNGYLNISDYRYYGSHLGDKASGINVKYASDPYWGEKAAAQGYILEQQNGNRDIDVNKSTIAIKGKLTVANIYKDSTTKSKLLYNTANDNDLNARRGNVGSYPFRVLESVSGESVNGSTTWYRIQSDAPLAADRSGVSYAGGGSYLMSSSYGYIPASMVSIVIQGGGNIPPAPDPIVRKGDVNNDGKISGLDYVIIRNKLDGKSDISADRVSAADVNNDGKITGLDYVLIRNHLDGKSIIQW